MKIDGGCHCGAITYEAEVDPEKTSICHCTDCQQLTGTAFRVSVRVPEENYRITRGTPKVYIKNGPKVYGIRVGTARQRDELVPKTQYWHRSALHWLPELPGTRIVEEQ
jgi:hypothetical protein